MAGNVYGKTNDYIWVNISIEIRQPHIIQKINDMLFYIYNVIVILPALYIINDIRYRPTSLVNLTIKKNFLS